MPTTTAALAQQSPLGFGYSGSAASPWPDLSNKRQRQDDVGGYDYTRDPYRQVSSYENRGAIYHNRQGAMFGDANHSRQSSQGPYPYPSPQGSDISSYYQSQPYTTPQNRMAIPYRTSDMMGHMTLDQSAGSPTSAQVSSHHYETGGGSTLPMTSSPMSTMSNHMPSHHYSESGAGVTLPMAPSPKNNVRSWNEHYSSSPASGQVSSHRLNEVGGVITLPNPSSPKHDARSWNENYFRPSGW